MFVVSIIRDRRNCVRNGSTKGRAVLINYFSQQIVFVGRIEEFIIPIGLSVTIIDQIAPRNQQRLISAVAARAEVHELKGGKPLLKLPGVTKNAVNNTNLLVGLGIAADWTFEKEFNKLLSCDVHCYDHSISFNYFLKLSIRHFIGCFFPRLLKKKIDAVILPIRYKLFFVNGKKHFKEKIGNDPETETNFEKIFSRIPEDKKVFLKIDIEEIQKAKEIYGNY